MSVNSAKWKALTEAYPFIASMRGCPQEAEFHSEGDVLTHSKRVLQEGEKLAEEWGLSEEEAEDLFFACTFHDIGKPITLTKDENGQWSSPKHAVKGASFLRYKLWEAGSHLPVPRRERILNLIKLHAWPVRFMERDHPEDSLIRASLVTSNKLLGLLAVADMTGRICEDIQAQGGDRNSTLFFGIRERTELPRCTVCRAICRCAFCPGERYSCH